MDFLTNLNLLALFEKLPAIIETSAPVFRAVSEPLGNIDKVVMIDQGGNSNGDGHQSGINRFAQTGPTVIFSLLQQLQALGLNIPEIMAQLGMDQDPPKASGKPVPKQTSNTTPQAPAPPVE